MRLHLLSRIDLSQTSSPRQIDEYAEDSRERIAILFADIVSSTKFFKANGNLAGRQLLKIHQNIASGCIAEHSGVLVKILGDSVLAYCSVLKRP